VPDELVVESLCVSHFTLSIEQTCAEMRRETARGTPSNARQKEIMRYIESTGEHLARVATLSPRLPDEMKARILNTFLTLMNLRENLDRAAQRTGTRG
jgi:hypothetical protein